MAKNLVNKWKSLVAENDQIGNSKYLSLDFTKSHNTTHTFALTESDEKEEEELPEKIEESKKSHHSKSSSKEKENGKKSKHHHSSSSHHHSHHSHHHSSSSKEHKEHKKTSESKHKSSSSSSHTSHHKTITPSSSSSMKRSYEEASLDAKENEIKAKKLKIDSVEKSDSKKSTNGSSSSTKANESKEHGSKSSKSKEHKHSSKRKHSKDDEPQSQEFDGSTGEIGFAEALMMFDMPSSSSGSKSKKQLADKMVSCKSSSSSSSKSSSSKHKSSSTAAAAMPAPNARPSTSASAAAPESSKRSLQTLTQPPKLLTQKPKLDLLPDIVSDIPNDVSIPDYRPLPLNHAIKDYIENNFGSFESRHAKKIDEAAQFNSSKANRTKVFSGNSKTRTEIPKLFDMCIRILQENIDFLECTGGVPFEILKPVLERAKPDQLSVIEYYNPYLLDESEILWKPHCQRKWKCKLPSEMETWREMYERCTKEDDEKLSRLTQNIKQHQEITSNGIQKTKMAYVDQFVKPPRGIMRKQEQFGTNRKLVASPAARTEGLKHLMPNIVSGQRGDVRLRVAAGLRDDAQQGKKHIDLITVSCPRFNSH
jgi:transcription elongation factor B polypeptide 3